MRVIVNQKAFYDWEPVPKDVVVTEQDVKSGRVRPDARGMGHLARVTKTADKHTTVNIAESTIIARIIHEAMPQNGSTVLSRKQAIGNLLSSNVMPHHAHPKHITGFVVDTDDGPNEAEFRAAIAPYVAAKHASGEPLIDPDQVDVMVDRYMAPETIEGHDDHLHFRFNVKRAAK